jgi:NAD(P)-dependent dehydrogenase (short-subunit alcohol dehydrogenase family)
MGALDGKVVVITGSAGGIGRYVAKTYGQAGARVVVADVKPLELIVGELKALEAECLAVPTDVSDESAVRNLINRTVERFGRLDVLHNNAAIVTHFHWGIPHWPRIRDLDLEFWNLLGVEARHPAADQIRRRRSAGVRDLCGRDESGRPHRHGRGVA